MANRQFSNTFFYNTESETDGEIPAFYSPGPTDDEIPTAPASRREGGSASRPPKQPKRSKLWEHFDQVYIPDEAGTFINFSVLFFC